MTETLPGLPPADMIAPEDPVIVEIMIENNEADDG